MDGVDFHTCVSAIGRLTAGRLSPLIFAESAGNLRRNILPLHSCMARILVVDDNDVLLSVVEQSLLEAGHSVVTAVDGADAAKKFRAEPFDLIITDLVMPNREGIEIIVELRKSTPQTRVIAISGGVHGSTTCLNLAEKLGAHLSLRKPFSRDELIFAVASLLPAAKGWDASRTGDVVVRVNRGIRDRNEELSR